MDQFDSESEDYGLRFATWGTQWKQVLDLINGSVQTIQLRLSEKQKELFNQRFAQLFSHAGYAYGGSMRSAVARIAINTCRILSIVALLRALENSSLPNKKFSILNFPFSIPPVSPPPRRYPSRISRMVSSPSWICGHRRGFPSRTHAHRASLPPFELCAGLPAYLRRPSLSRPLLNRLYSMPPNDVLPSAGRGGGSEERHTRENTRLLPQTDAGEGNTDQDRTGRVRFLLARVCA